MAWFNPSFPMTLGIFNLCFHQRCHAAALHVIDGSTRIAIREISGQKAKAVLVVTLAYIQHLKMVVVLTLVKLLAETAHPEQLFRHMI